MQRVVRMEALSEAFRMFGQAPGQYMLGALPVMISMIVYYGLYFGIQFAIVGFPQQKTQDIGVIFGALGFEMVLVFFFTIAYYWCLAGLVNMALKHLRGEVASAKNVFSMEGMGWSVVGLSLLNALIVGFGVMLCCIPGLIFQGLLMVSVPLLLDRRLSISTAIGESWTAVKPSMWTATGLMLVSGLVLGMSVYACGVGLLVGAPIYALVQAITYRDLYWENQEAMPMAPYEVNDRTPPPSDVPPYDV
jgi:hypothetical protein